MYGHAVTRDPDAGTLYAAARESVSELVRSLGPDQLAAPVVACPGWMVHDVVSHLAGVATDAVNNVGATADVENAAARHVADRRETHTAVVLREWERSSSQFEVVLAKGGNPLPPAVLDVITHEHDIRTAVGVAGSRDDEPLRVAATQLMSEWTGRVDSAVLAPVAVVDMAGTVVAGPDDAPVRFRSSLFEFFRAAMGRRSTDQLIRRFSGTDEPLAYIDLLCLRGCAPADLVE